jgi:hypothetical protein
VGLRFAPGSQLHVAAVVRNIGRPVARDSVLRITGATGLAWQAARALRLSAEAVAVERRPVDGYDLSWRTGMQLGISNRGPIRVLAALRLDHNLRLQRWSVGIALGGLNQLVGVTTGEREGTRNIESISASAVSTRVMR